MVGSMRVIVEKWRSRVYFSFKMLRDNCFSGGSSFKARHALHAFQKIVEDLMADVTTNDYLNFSH